MLHSVVIVSCSRDLPVNRVAFPALMEHVSSRSYAVIVPKQEISRFRSSLPGEVEVLAEDEFLNGWSLGRIAETLPSTVKERAGWYFQQFLKLDYLRGLPETSEALIWDGDTVPLRSIDFKDHAGRVGFYVARERYEPYFVTIRRLLDMPRAQPNSFIAQCMYVRVRWIKSMLALIETRAGSSWLTATTNCITGGWQSEFSEYETIGTFVATRYPEEVFLNPRPWFRWGMGHFGSIDRVTRSGLARLARSYDYVALESWDQGRAAWMRSRTQRFLDTVRRPLTDTPHVRL